MKRVLLYSNCKSNAKQGSMNASRFKKQLFKALVLSKALDHYFANILAHSVFIGNAMLNFATAEVDMSYLIFFFCD